MNKKINLKNTTVTYKAPAEDINKKLKDDIIYSLTHQFNQLDVLGPFIAVILAGMLVGTLLVALFVWLAESIVGSQAEFISIGLAAKLGTILSLIFALFIYAMLKRNTKQILLLANTVNYDEFFREYEYKTRNSILISYNTYLLDACSNYRVLNDMFPSIIDLEIYTDTILRMRYKLENGDVRTVKFDIIEVIENLNITEPELRVDYGYKLTLAVPRKEL